MRTHILAIFTALLLLTGNQALAEHGDLSNFDNGSAGASLPGSLADTSQGAPGSGGSISLDGGIGTGSSIPALSQPETISEEEAYNPEIRVPTLASWEASRQGRGGELAPRNLMSARKWRDGRNQQLRLEVQRLDAMVK